MMLTKQQNVDKHSKSKFNQSETLENQSNLKDFLKVTIYDAEKYKTDGLATQATGDCLQCEFTINKN